MGLLSKLKSNSSSSSTTPDTASTMTNSSTTPLTTTDPLNPSTTAPRKKSLYEKYQDRKRGPGTSDLSDEDFAKYTGKTREEFDAWKQTAPGVAGGQAAGSILAGGNSGLGTSAVSEGNGGWGFGAGKTSEKGGERIIR